MTKLELHRGRSVWAEALLIVLGVVIAVGPYTLYPICDASMHGGCYDTGIAEVVLGILLVLVGVASLFVQDVRRRRLLWIALIAIPVLSILFVTSITGTCGGSMMACNKTGEPGIVAVGAVTAIVAVFDLLLLQNDARRVG